MSKEMKISAIDFVSTKLGKEKIEQLKKEHGNLFAYKSDDDKWCVLKQPSLLILDACTVVSKGSEMQFDINLVSNCWIDGDETLKSDTGCFMGLRRWVWQVIKIVDGEMGEL